MRKKIDRNKYFTKKDLGFTIRYIQNGQEYDEHGLSIKDYPTEEELLISEKEEISRVKRDNSYIKSQSGQLYKTMMIAKAAAGRKHLDLSKHEFVEFSEGVAIKYVG